jgi:hypothetical protein
MPKNRLLAAVQAKDACCDKSSYHRRAILTEKQLRSYDKEFYSLLVKFLVNGLFHLLSVPPPTEEKFEDLTP